MSSPPSPTLRIVPIHSLVEHEYNDIQRTLPLAKRLEAEGLLKNPPIVAQLEGEQRYVVLDGANRTTALAQLHYEHCLVQVVNYEPPQVTLSTWHHLVTGIGLEPFTQEIAAVNDIDLHQSDLLRARAELAQRELIACIIRSDNKVLAVSSHHRRIHDKNTVLNAMVDTYKEKGGLHRAVADNIDEARKLFPNVTALVIFPNYESSEVMILARDGELLPTGLTRHLIQGRVLRVNYPLSELKSNETLEKKNAKLQEWMQKKNVTKEVRLYAE
ncbi:MAG: hypothetical protein HY740_05195, partial [Chloroflexi bacterium]|nr:hypothetical protein [Chloroflexota bacterium]